MLYTARKIPAVISLNPYIAVNESSERSAYCTLLLHSPWGVLGEAALLGDFANAVERLASLYNELPPYVRASLDRRRASETLLADTGTPFADRTATTAADFDEFMAEQDELAEQALNANPDEFVGV